MPEPFDNIDEVLSRKLREIAPPPGLREQLLAAGAPVEEARPVRWWARGFAAAAAAVVLVLSILAILPTPARPQSLAVATSEMASFLSDGFSLEMRTADPGKVQSWLASKNPNHPVTLPAALAKHRALGCRNLFWRGHVGSLACFQMSGGREAHLAMFSENTFRDAPGDKPLIASAGAWTCAAWSRDGMTYILFVPAGMDPMQELAALGSQQIIASSSFPSTACPLMKASSGVARISSGL